MSIPITFNGVSYDVPEFRDTNYANELTQFFVAIPNGTLQPTGGLFTLLSEVDFGASYGLKSLYVKSRATNPAAAGIFRLGNAESVSWRNAANGADLALLVNSSNELMFNGAQVLTGSGPSSYVASLAGTANQVIASGATGAVTLSLPQSIATTSNLRFGSLTLNGAADASALLTLASTTQGFLPPRMTTTQRDAIVSPAEGLTIYNTSTGQMNLYASGIWTALTMSAGGTVNAGTQYQLGYYAANGTAISGLTAITASKALVSDANGLPVASTLTTTELQAIHALTASRALVSDGSGLVSVSAATATEVGYLSGVTSAIQTQMDLKAPLASPIFTGVVTIPTPFTLGATSVTATGAQMNFLVGVTSAIQTQIDAKAPTASPTFTGTITTPLTASRALVTGASSELAVSAVTATELGFVSGVTSAIQTQLNLLAPKASPSFTGVVLSANGAANAPTYSFTGDPDTGMYSSGANQVGFSANGALVMTITTAGLSLIGSASMSDGSTGTPAVNFISDPDTGLYLLGANDLGFVTGGSRRADISSAGLRLLVDLIDNSTASVNIGTATNYFNDVSYKTLTDRGCLPWCDDGVELADGTRVTDLEALCAIKKHSTKKTGTGLPRLDYRTFPKHSFRKVEEQYPKWAVKRDKDGEPWVTEEDGTVKKAEDGVEMTMLFGVMIGAFKEVSTELAQLKKKIAALEAK